MATITQSMVYYCSQYGPVIAHNMTYTVAHSIIRTFIMVLTLLAMYKLPAEQCVLERLLNIITVLKKGKEWGVQWVRKEHGKGKDKKV